MTKTKRGNGEGSVHPLPGRPGFRAQVTLSNGSRPTKQCRTIKEARAWIKEQQERDRRGFSSAGATQTLGEWMATWFETRRLKVAPRTLESEQSNARLYFGPVVNIPLHHLTPGRIEDWLADVEHKGRIARPNRGQPHTVRLCHSLMSSILRDAVRHRLLAESPMTAVPRPRVPQPKPKYISEEDTRRLVAAVMDTGDPRCIAVLLMVRLGLRRNEALGLTWSDIDLDTGVVQVRFQLGRLKLEGRTQLVRRELKTLSSRRTLVLAGELLGQIRHVHDTSRWSEPQDFVVTVQGGHPADPDAMSHWLRSVGESVNVAVTPHRLRHTSATLMLNAGVPIEAVGKVLGHPDIRTTGVYAKVLDRTGAAALETLASVLDQ